MSEPYPSGIQSPIIRLAMQKAGNLVDRLRTRILPDVRKIMMDEALGLLREFAMQPVVQTQTQEAQAQEEEEERIPEGGLGADIETANTMCKELAGKISEDMFGAYHLGIIEDDVQRRILQGVLSVAAWNLFTIFLNFFADATNVDTDDDVNLWSSVFRESVAELAQNIDDIEKSLVPELSEYIDFGNDFLEPGLLLTWVQSIDAYNDSRPEDEKITVGEVKQRLKSISEYATEQLSFNTAAMLLATSLQALVVIARKAVDENATADGVEKLKILRFLFDANARVPDLRFRVNPSPREEEAVWTEAQFIETHDVQTIYAAFKDSAQDQAIAQISEELGGRELTGEEEQAAGRAADELAAAAGREAVGEILRQVGKGETLEAAVSAIDISRILQQIQNPEPAGLPLIFAVAEGFYRQMARTPNTWITSFPNIFPTDMAAGLDYEALQRAFIYDGSYDKWDAAGILRFISYTHRGIRGAPVQRVRMSRLDPDSPSPFRYFSAEADAGRAELFNANTIEGFSDDFQARISIPA